LANAEAGAKDRQDRLIIIGLDGGCPDLIEEWITQGKLPNLKKLTERGSKGILKSTILPITPTAWTSFLTGKNPGKHGVFDFTERKEGLHELQLVLVGQKPGSLWKVLTQSDKRVIVINVPMTYPPAKVNGVMISGLPALDTRRDFTYPSHILEEIEREIGEYRIHYKVEFTGENHEDFLRDVHFLIERRGQVARYLAENYPWDLMMVHFQATDWVQHFFWKYADPNHPNHDPFPSIARHAIRDVYTHIDKELGKIIKACHEDTNFIVMSDHGFGPLYKVVYLNNYLNKLGYLHFKKGPKYFLHKLGVTSANFYRLIIKLGLGNMVPKFRHGKQRMISLFLSYNDI
jgi:predicted AlkP superfamily phosphohydrolase/phosphomutase